MRLVQVSELSYVDTRFWQVALQMGTDIEIQNMFVAHDEKKLSSPI